MEPSTGAVDWDTAARIAGRLSRPGPTASRDDLTALVADLRAAAGQAAGHAARITRLSPADGADPQDVSRVLVVDRPGWAQANTAMLAAMSRPLTEQVAASGRTVPARARVAAAAQVGAVLALLSSRVLGQFDPFTAAPGDPGRLLLVAPNVLHLERTLHVDPADFRLWVALHEQTHALQFAAAPWLADHLRDRTGRLLADLVGSVLRDEARRTEDDSGATHGDGPARDGGTGEDGPTARDGGPARDGHHSADEGPPGDDGRAVVELARSVRRALSGDGDGVLGLLPPEQQRAFEDIGAVMALLEGHADVAMDAVGASVVPTVRTIRRAFEARRDSGARSRGPQRLVRRLLGMDTKLAQYRDGAVFVRAVRRAVGMRGLNAVWTDPALLPSPAEIAEPAAWVRRVHG